MNVVRVETTVEIDSELHLTDLPCRRGDQVEAIERLVYGLYGLTEAEIRIVKRGGG